MFECLSGSQKKEEPVASEGMFQAYGGLFIFKALNGFKAGGRNLQGDNAKRSEIHKLQGCHV